MYNYQLNRHNVGINKLAHLQNLASIQPRTSPVKFARPLATDSARSETRNARRKRTSQSRFAYRTARQGTRAWSADSTITNWYDGCVMRCVSQTRKDCASARGSLSCVWKSLCLF